jgi:hypothetical protein
MESPEKPSSPQEKKHPFSMAKNRMQVDLMNRSVGESIEANTRWIERYGRPLKELVERRPELLDAYQVEPGQALAEVEAALYGNAPATDGQGVEENRS